MGGITRLPQGRRRYRRVVPEVVSKGHEDYREKGTMGGRKDSVNSEYQRGGSKKDLSGEDATRGGTR